MPFSFLGRPGRSGGVKWLAYVYLGASLAMGMSFSYAAVEAPMYMSDGQHLFIFVCYVFSGLRNMRLPRSAWSVDGG